MIPPKEDPQTAKSSQDTLAEIGTKVDLAFGVNLMEPGTPVNNEVLTLLELSRRLTQHEERNEKMGAYFCAPMANGSRNGANAQPWGLFVFDFDGKTGKKPDPEQSKAFFSKHWHIGYTTHSYTPENGKHRVVLLCDRELSPEEYREMFEAWTEILPFEPDKKLNHSDQPVFLPSCRPGAERSAWANEGMPLDVDAFFGVYREEKAAESQAMKARAHAGDGVIEEFNRACNIERILESHGYQRLGKRYLHPHSESGKPSLVILGSGNICYSHSSGDPLGDGKVHDAFDVYRILEHGGDMDKAIREAAANLGISKQESDRRLLGKKQGEKISPDEIQPEPLRAELAPPDPYPVEMLGVVLGGAAEALHQTIKAPLALCCQSVLGAASLAAQAHFDVILPWGDIKPLSLFLLTVGESGERKSAVDDAVLGAAKKQEKEDQEIYQRELQAYEFQHSAWSEAVESAKKAVRGNTKAAVPVEAIQAAVASCGEKPEPPLSPLRFVTDPTVEGLFKLLAAGQPSVALFSDEGGLLIGGHALNSDNALKTMARWCKLWDGSPFDRVRAGDGSGILYGRRMALHQLAQPEVMVKLLGDPMANGQGFLARCLPAWPTSTIGTRQVTEYVWIGDRPEVKRLYGKLKGLMESIPLCSPMNPQELTPIALPLSPGAQQIAIGAGNSFESLMATGNDLSEIRDRGSKALENACRIAAILAVMDGGLGTREITDDHLIRAITLMQWYLGEALRIRAAAVVPQAALDAEVLLNWLKERGITVFRTAPLLRGGPPKLRNKVRLTEAVNEAERCGYLEEQEPGALVDGVKTKKSWRVLRYEVV